MNATRLSSLMRQAVFDHDLKRLLFEHPERAVALYGLTADEELRLVTTSRSDFDSAVSKFVLHKILPMPLGEHLVVIPETGKADDFNGRMAIILDQSLTGANIGIAGTSENRGSVFGSGTHPTTRLGARMLEKYVLTGMRVLDLGTGSGVLALAAAKLGAGEVIALDVDPDAISLADANAHRNGLQGIVHSFVGDVSWLISNGIGLFDLVVSNILADIHCASLEAGLTDSIQPGGLLIFSGIQRKGVDLVGQALNRAGSEIIDLIHRGPWYALAARVSGTHRSEDGG